MKTISPPALVFDVESIGLHGEAFAVGYVVVGGRGAEQEAGTFACPPEAAAGTPENRAWVRENIPPLASTHPDPRGVRDAFWARWLHWKERDAIIAAHCAWPVEARFLLACVEDDPASREWLGPYPLHDVASLLLARGRDPLGGGKRFRDELPEHHPLADARQAARLAFGRHPAPPGRGLVRARPAAG